MDVCIIYFWKEEGKEIKMQQEIILSIDFGSKKLSASMATKDRDGEMEILAVESCKSNGIEKGIIKDIDKCSEDVNNLLMTIEEKTKKNISDVYIGISARKSRITEVSICADLEEHVVRSQDIIKMIEKAKKSITIGSNEVIIDALINFYILDGRVIHKDIINWRGKKLEIDLTIVVAEKAEIEKYYEIFSGLKYNVKSIKLNILTGKQIFINEKNLMDNIALVDIGAGKTDIAVFNDGYVKAISSVPLGGNNISNDLAICGDISFLEADNIKRIYSSEYRNSYENDDSEKEIKIGVTEISKELFYEVTNARIEEILNHIKIELKNTGHYDRICSIILYGDGLSYFEDISKVANEILKVNTKIITRDDLGIKKSENITSLAVTKEVYDILDILDYNENDLTNGYNTSIPISEKIESKKISKIENLENIEGKDNIFKKLKGFLDKIF